MAPVCSSERKRSKIAAREVAHDGQHDDDGKECARALHHDDAVLQMEVGGEQQRIGEDDGADEEGAEAPGPRNAARRDRRTCRSRWPCPGAASRFSSASRRVRPSRTRQASTPARPMSETTAVMTGVESIGVCLSVLACEAGRSAPITGFKGSEPQPYFFY